MFYRCWSRSHAKSIVWKQSQRDSIQILLRRCSLSSKLLLSARFLTSRRCNTLSSASKNSLVPINTTQPNHHGQGSGGTRIRALRSLNTARNGVHNQIFHDKQTESATCLSRQSHTSPRSEAARKRASCWPMTVTNML